jgi:ATP-dependent DNA helicase RecG
MTFPISCRQSLDAMPRVWALRQIHFPANAEALAKARRHLVLTEFFAMQMCISAKRAEQAALPGEVHSGGGS